MSIEDFKNAQGMWVRSAKVGGVKTHTKAALLWENMCARTRVGGAYQNLRPSYVGTSHQFENFQDFASWCQNQIGYYDNFAMDKDLLVKGNKIYCKEYILFVPQEINGAIVTCLGGRGRNPIGVVEYKGKYSVQCRDPMGGRIDDANYRTKEEAFERYKTIKSGVLKLLAYKWRDKIDERAYSALRNHKVDIDD